MYQLTCLEWAIKKQQPNLNQNLAIVIDRKKKAPHSVESLANFLQPVTILNVSFYLFLNLAILHCTCTTR